MIIFSIVRRVTCSGNKELRYFKISDKNFSVIFRSGWRVRGVGEGRK